MLLQQISQKIGLIIVYSALSLVVQAEELQINPAQVLSVVTADWNNDGGFDRALLLLPQADSDEADLYIYLSDADSNTMLQVSHKAKIVWVGGMWGTQPSLKVNKKGSLILKSANESIGRNRWQQKLTIAYRKGHFVVAGYTYSAHDTLDLDYKLKCDINLLTGKGKKNGKKIKVDLASKQLDSFSMEPLESACQ